MKDDYMLSNFDLSKLTALKDAGGVNIYPMTIVLSILANDKDLADEGRFFGKYYELLPHINFLKAADYACMNNYSFFCRFKNLDSKVNELSDLYPTAKKLDDVVKAAIRNTTKFARARAEERGIEIPILYDSDTGIEYADLSVLEEFKNPQNRLESDITLPSSKSSKSKLQETFDRLDSALMEADVKFDTRNLKLFYTDSITNERKVIDNFNVTEFSSFLRLVFRTSTYFGMKQMLTNNKEAKKYVEQMLKSDKFIANYASSNVIQFLDCYVEHGHFKPGISPQIPRFYINRKVYETVKSGKTQTQCGEMDDLIAHLCRYDEATIESFKSRFSTFLMNDSDLKSGYEVTANILFGASGGNGKSLFVECLQRAVGDENVGTSTFSGFDNSNYELPSMCNSLIVVDGDIKDAQLSGEMSGAFKLFVFGQDLSTRDIFHGASTFRPCTMLVGCTNHMLSAADKSGGFARRFSIFGQPQKLLTPTSNRDTQWIESVKSDRAAQYLIELLVLAHIKDMESGHLVESSDSMTVANGLFANANDSAQMYVEEVGMSEVILKPVRAVKRQYEEWCEMNNVQPLKNKFQSSMSSKFNLVNASIVKDKVNLDESDLMSNGFGPNIKMIRCWKHNHKLVNDKYRARFEENASVVESIDLVKDDEELVKLIVEAILEDVRSSLIAKEEIVSYVSLVFDFRENHPRLATIMPAVLKHFNESYASSATKVKYLNKDVLNRLMKFAKYDASLKHSLSKRLYEITVYDLSSKKD